MIGMIFIISGVLYLISRLVNGFRWISDSIILLCFCFIAWRLNSGEIDTNSLLNIILILILFFYSISDILWGIRVIGLSVPGINSWVLKYIDLKDFLQEKVRIHLSAISEFILVILLILLFCVQVLLKNFPHISFENQSMLELLGFDIAIFSLYGIYVAFLQYLTENDKHYYLGRSKTQLMLNSSIWSQFTRTKLFHILLLAIVVIPIISKVEYFQSLQYLEYLWQSAYILILVVYIFLLNLNLKIAYSVFRLNREIRYKKITGGEKKDNKKNLTTRLSNVDSKIKVSLQRSYKEFFWKVYKNQDNYVTDFISRKLANDFLWIEKFERDEFVSVIFGIEYLENCNLAYSIQEYVDKEISSEDSIKFFKFYKTFCQEKWKFLRDYQNDISSTTWETLIQQDIDIFSELVENDETLEVLKIEYSKEHRTFYLYSSKIKEYLFSLLISKQGVNVDILLENLTNEISKVNQKDVLYNYKYNFIKFRLVKIFELYENEIHTITLPKFKTLSEEFDSEKNKRNGFDNSILYSKICFAYLDRGRIADFNNNDIIKKLILSMNEEYQLAFMLFQLLYTDNQLWDNNLEFYNEQVKRIMHRNSQFQDYLFEQAKSIILKTNISHRITDQFLDTLWKTRTEKISDVTWFDQFGHFHRQSDFKILYIQWLLSNGNSLTNRFDLDSLVDKKIKVSTNGRSISKAIKADSRKIHWKLQNKKQRLSYFCREYLLFIDRLPYIFTMENAYSSKNDLQISVEYLLQTNKASIKNVIEKNSLVSLLRLEWILKRGNIFSRHRYNYTSRTLFDATISNNYYWYGEDSLVQFYILKLVDGFYEDLYMDASFVKAFKQSVLSILKSNNNIYGSIGEYVDSIFQELPDKFSVSPFEQEQIIYTLNKILFNQDEENKRVKKKYRYR